MSEWPILRSDGGDFGMSMHSRGFVRSPRCAACSVIRKRESSPSNGAQKNDLQLLWSSALGLVRPTHTARSRSVVWRRAHLSGHRGASGAVQELRAREARAARLPGGQSLLYQAVCLLRWLADNPFYTKRFAYYVGRRCRQATIKDIAEELRLHWETIKTLEKQYMRAQLARVGAPRPKAIGIDEIPIRKGHTYRIVVSDLIEGARSGSGERTAKRRAWRCSMTGWARRGPGAFAWR